MRSLSYKLLMVITFIVLPGSAGYKVNGQDLTNKVIKTYFTAGFGILDLFNAGFDFYSNNFQAGFSIGAVPAMEKPFSFSADLCYYFGGYTEKSVMKPWYARAGIQYYSEKGKTYYDKMTFLNPRIGRKFFFSEKAGLEIDGGLMILLAQKEYYETSPFINFDMSFFPGLSLSFFHQIDPD